MKNINPYILLCISIFITLLYGLLRNVYSKKYVKRNADIYLLNTLSTVFSIIVILISSGGISKTSFYTIALGTLYGVSIITGVCVALANIFNMYLSGVMSSVFFFPVVNGSNVILSAVAGIIICKEKMSVKQWFGLCIGVVAILLLCM